MLALLGAFRQEITGLRKDMAIEEVVPGPVCRIYRGRLKGKECLLVQTGVGKDRAEKAAQFVLESHPVTALISLGFAGALIPDLQIGDVVVCSTLHSASGSDREGAEPAAYATDMTLYDLASQGTADETGRFLAGTCVTVPRLVTSAPRKQGLNHAFHAQIVDMESYWIARISATRGVPFIAIRSVSDTLQDDLRPLDHILDSEGRLLWKKVVPYFLIHPQHLPIVFATLRNMQRAETNLTAFLSDLVTRI